MKKFRLLTLLALLLTAVTGARAQWTGVTYTATATENLGAITVNADATLTINEGVTVTVTGGINVASGTLTVTGPGTLVVTGANGADGGVGYDGGTGGNGGVAISGNIIVQGGATVTATGGNGGNGGYGYGHGGNGGNGGNAFAGTLTYKSGTVTANGGSGGSGGLCNMDGPGPSGSAGNAFANDVDFTQTTGYSVTNGTSTIGSVLNQTKVVISGGTPAAPTTFTVELKANTDDASNWTGKAGTATEFSALPLEGLSPGDAVTLTYGGRRKVKTVTATLLQMQSLTIAKGSTELSGDKVLYYMPGDTYLQALARKENQSTGGLGWGYYPDNNYTTLYFKEVTTKAWDVAIDGDSNFAPGKGSCDITLDTEINPTGHTFQFVGTQK